MMEPMRNVAVSTCVVLGLLSVAGPAQHAQSFGFEHNGVLPSADPNVSLFNNSGFLENSLYQVAGGLLQQRTRRINGNVTYQVFDQGAPIRFSPALHTILEARLQVLAINGQAGSFFQAGDGMDGYGVWLTPNGVDVPTRSGIVSIPVDVFQFHTYRIESPANSNVVTLFIDDVQVLTDTAAGSSFFFANWGDGKTAAGNGADTDWAFVRFTNGAATYAPFGQGCAGTTGTPVLTSVGGQLPFVGSSFEVQVANALPGTPVGLVVGFSNAFSAGMILPINLTPPFKPGCIQYVSFDFIISALTDMSGVAGWSLPLLNSPSLVGLEFFLQCAALDAGANPLVVSNAAEGVIGIK